MAESFGVTLLLVMVGLFFLFRFVFLWYWKIDKILSELQQQTDWMKKTAINTKYLRDRLAPDETQDLV